MLPAPCAFTLGEVRRAGPPHTPDPLAAAHLWCTCLKLKFKNQAAHTVWRQEALGKTKQSARPSETMACTLTKIFLII